MKLRKIILYYNKSNLYKTRTMTSLMAISDQKIVVAKGMSVDIYDSADHIQIQIPKTDGDNDNIVDITFSPDCTHLTLITSTSKRLFVYNFADIQSPKLFHLPRAANKATFIEENNNILIADKTGDVLLFNINDEKDKGVKLFGHLSLLLDVIVTDDRKFIITCDRDEKIRVSCYPNTYNIQTFCLGHKEFVKHLKLLPHNKMYLTSSSGDGTIKIWNYMSGKLCYEIDTSGDFNETGKKEFIDSMDKDGVEVKTLPIIHFSISAISENTSIAAAAVYSLNKVLLYSIREDDGKFEHFLVHTISLQYFPASIQFNGSSLYVFDSDQDKVEVYTQVKDEKHFDLVQTINVFIGETIIDIISESDLIKVLYKRKFDNVQEYIERKKLRLEKKIT